MWQFIWYPPFMKFSFFHSYHLNFEQVVVFKMMSSSSAPSLIKLLMNNRFLIMLEIWEILSIIFVEQSWSVLSFIRGTGVLFWRPNCSELVEWECYANRIWEASGTQRKNEFSWTFEYLMPSFLKSSSAVALETFLSMKAFAWVLGLGVSSLTEKK